MISGNDARNTGGPSPLLFMVIGSLFFQVEAFTVFNGPFSCKSPFVQPIISNLKHQCVLTTTAMPTPSSRYMEALGNVPNSSQMKTSMKYSQSTALFSSFAMDVSEELIPAINAIDECNDDLETLLCKLRDQNYFRLYSVDMLGSCEYMPQELFECYSESCEIYPTDEDEVPDLVKKSDAQEFDFDLDGWARMDMPSEDYYDTDEFPEEYTGYDGSDVWNFIHRKICFQTIDDHDEDWKADFNKAVSGLHSMISAQIVRGIEAKAATSSLPEGSRWNDPIAEYKRRLSPEGDTPHAMENLYFGFMLLLSAVGQARDRLTRDCESGKIDVEAASTLLPVLDFELLQDSEKGSVSVASAKLHEHAVKDEDNLWEARMRTRELFRIMNCVQCNKCRLHGKIAVLGLSTALQVLLGRTGKGGDPTRIHRVELAALMTTLSKFSTAIKYCNSMAEKI